MRLLGFLPNGDFCLTEKFLDDAIPPYAILSHTWGGQEVTFEDMVKDSGRSKGGYEKIKFCGEQAARDDLTYFWVDSCCIKKSSDSELSESINSMFRWYQRAVKCYVYLSDVSTRTSKERDENSYDTWEQSFQESRWFTRGWTLQELLAPPSVEFFSNEGSRLGDKQSLEQQIYEITGIPISALRGSALSRFTTEQKFNWAKNRKTTREEDSVYSLLGIFQISMPAIYGEGRSNADRRLKKEIEDAPKFSQVLLSHLRFKAIRDREYAIPETYQNTYRWIFDRPSQDVSWSSFVDWMQSDEQLYWITGKAGSGKSTLMKFIREDERTFSLLHHWAEGHKINLFSFYFWNSGSKVQMSQEGLLRTILAQALESRPELAATLFPEREEHFLISASLQWVSWTWAELISAFRTLTAELSSTENIVFFIDGLDEYDGPHDKLIEFVRSVIGQHQRIKVCVSSRPWVVFEDGFHRTPSLRLEDLTRGDIQNYIETKLEAHPVFDRLKSLHLSRAEGLINDIINKAAGVFLWVVLVVQSFLEGLSEGEHLSDLQARLDALPPDLEDLFWKILKSLDERHFKRTCQFFRVIVAVDTTEDLFTWTLIDMEEPAFHSLDWKNPTEVDLEADLMRRRLNACTRGLIHTVGPPSRPISSHSVTVLHRTVGDFILRDDIRSEIFKASEGYNAEFHISKAYVWRMPFLDADSLDSTSNRKDYCKNTIQSILNHAMASDPEGNPAQVQLVDKMDKAAGAMVRKFLGHSRLGLQRNWRNHMSSWSVVLKSNSFLQFAVAWQLTPYVKAKLKTTKLTQGELDDLLSIALTVGQNLDFNKAASGERTNLGANISLISILLEKEQIQSRAEIPSQLDKSYVSLCDELKQKTQK